MDQFELAELDAAELADPSSKNALHRSFHDNNRSISQEDLLVSLNEITPQADSMKKEIEELVTEARAIGRMASERSTSSGGGSTY